jgi:two-component system nitrogen regulation sensor histidine kinase NtrY
VNVWLRWKKRLPSSLKIMITFSVCFIIYVIISRLKIPFSLCQTNLFSPRDFAYSSWLASLGEFVLLSILMFHVAQTFIKLGNFEKGQKVAPFWTFFSFLFAAFFFSFSVVLLKILLLNSNISLEFFNDLKFSMINLYAFFAISLHIISFIIILLKLRAVFFEDMGFCKFVSALFVSGAVAGIAVSMLCFPADWTPFIYYILVIFIIARFDILKIREYKYTFLLIMSIAGASYVNLYAQGLILEKKNKVLDLWAVKLSSERDSGAEIFLSELDNKLRKDTMIQSHLLPPYKTL